MIQAAPRCAGTLRRARRERGTPRARADADALATEARWAAARASSACNS
ncbi:hypothetical protein [Streptomyces misionensis]